MAVIELNPAILACEWSRYVDAHPKGKFCHLPVWKSIIQESLRHQPYYLFAIDGNQIRGILPLFLINSAFNGAHLVSLPFFPSGGPIADSREIVMQLVKAASCLSDKLRCRYLELRMDEDLDVGFDISDYYSTFLLKIDNPDLLWKKMHQKGVRWAIRRAQRYGINVKTCSDSLDLSFFYSINFLTTKRLGLPCHPYLFFRNIFAKAPANAELYIAELNKVPIAGIICFKYKDTIEYAYGASDRRYLGCHANHLLVWQAIRDGYRSGYRYFDFGRTSSAHEGLLRYKKHWGGERKLLHNHYYPGVPNLISGNGNGIKYRLVTKMWQRLPLPLARFLNRVACKQLD